MLTAQVCLPYEDSISAAISDPVSLLPQAGRLLAQQGWCAGRRLGGGSSCGGGTGREAGIALRTRGRLWVRGSRLAKPLWRRATAWQVPGGGPEASGGQGQRVRKF